MEDRLGIAGAGGDGNMAIGRGDSVQGWATAGMEGWSFYSSWAEGRGRRGGAENDRWCVWWMPRAVIVSSRAGCVEARGVCGVSAVSAVKRRTREQSGGAGGQWCGHQSSGGQCESERTEDGR